MGVTEEELEEAAGVVAEEDKPTSSVDDENTLPHGVEKIPRSSPVFSLRKPHRLLLTAATKQ